MKLLADYNVDELKEIAVTLGQKGYRAAQVFKWAHMYKDYADMSDLPLEFRDKLSLEYAAKALTCEKKLTAKDGTAKHLFKLWDGNLIESVLMEYTYGRTLCVSTQAGCRMGCRFCASGKGGLLRNLSAGEILSQILYVNAEYGGALKERAVQNVVLMGSGEPLDNYDNVVKFIRLASAKEGINIGQRGIALSTCGLGDKMRRLADEGFSVMLTVSLHATTDKDREALMPVNRAFPLAEVLSASRYYFEKTGRRITFEYTLIKNFNMSEQDAFRLAAMLRGIPTHLNLIMLNETGDKALKPCTRAEAEEFKTMLEERGVTCTVRRSLGSEIEGACGQLRSKFVGQKDPENSPI